MESEALSPSSQVSTIRSYQESKYNMMMVLDSNPVKSSYYLKSTSFQTFLFIPIFINKARQSHPVDSIHALICLSEFHFFV